MKRILCYGDSNTWGYNPASLFTPCEERYPEEIRWPMRLQALLGESYRIIEEGLGGRTTVLDDPYSLIDLNGRRYLPPCLVSHSPLDMVILSLGTNDQKTRFACSTHDIANGIETLIALIQASEAGPGHSAPKILVISPIAITEQIRTSRFSEYFDAERVAQYHRQLPSILEKIADLRGCLFLDSNQFVSSELDAVHYTPESHLHLAEGLSKMIPSII